MNVFYVYLLLCGHQLCSFGHVSVPNFSTKIYYQEGDAVIAFLYSMHDESDKLGEHCGSNVYLSSLQELEAVVYRVNQINLRDDLLPNITLGFVAADTCNRGTSALAAATYVMQHTQESYDGTVSFKNIIGFLGPTTSGQTIAMAPYIGNFHLPNMGLFASSDELSDKRRFPYYLRLLPPDSFQAKAMVHVSSYFRWTYISFLYSEGSYGETAAKLVERQMKSYGFCFAYESRVPSEGAWSSFAKSVSEIIASGSKAVLLFMIPSHLSLFFGYLEMHGLISNGFVFLSSDTLSLVHDQLAAENAFFITYPVPHEKEFETHYLALNPENNQKNPWMNELWEQLFECSWVTTNSTTKDCNEFTDITQSEKFVMTPFPSKTIDSVTTYATALHNMVSKKCPDAFKNVSLLQTCFDGTELLLELKNTSFQGLTDYISFDEKGDMMGSYAVKQYHGKAGSKVLADVVVGGWFPGQHIDTLNIDESKIRWFKVDAENNSDYVTNLESVCSLPCGPKEYKVLTDIHCCWDCKVCRVNEILVNQSTCNDCPLLTWPDESTQSQCEIIQPKFIEWSDPVSIALSVCGAFGVVETLAIAVFFFWNRHTKLVKASGKEMSTLILIGTALAYSSIFAFLVKPSEAWCLVNLIGFHWSVSMIYTPLAIKTNRIYRIFEGGKKGLQKPLFTGPRAQRLMVIILLSVQAIIIAVSILVFQIQVTRQMPIPTQRFVELFCDVPTPVLFIPMSFNIILTLVCVFYGFLTRKLPENFNEAWFIFISVCATLLLWLLLLPSYFLAFYAHQKAIILAFSLALKAFITLLLLFVPKIYAIHFVSDEKIKASAGTTIGTVSTIASGGT